MRTRHDRQSAIRHLGHMFLCTNCGVRNPVGSRHCGQCGQPLRSPTVTDQQSRTSELGASGGYAVGYLAGLEAAKGMGPTRRSFPRVFFGVLCFLIVVQLGCGIGGTFLSLGGGLQDPLLGLLGGVIILLTVAVIVTAIIRTFR